MRTIHVGLYGDVDLNILDGSAIWLASLAEVLSGHPRTSVRVLLKASEERDVITGGLRALDDVHLVRPDGAGRRLTQAQAVAALVDLDREQRFDAVIVRGRRVAALAADSSLSGRLWTYLTDIPQSLAALGEDDRTEIVAIGEASAVVLAQTEELRAYLEAICPPARGRTVLLPPMVPELFRAPHRGRTDAGPFRLLYAGKFAPMWGFLEAVEAFRALQRSHPDLEFHVIGDKVHDPPDDPDFKPRVSAALASGDGLVWHGGRPREEVAALLRRADLALSARDAAMSDSLELSTKLLEYGAAGLPVVMNRTEMHERLYGVDYPLFIDGLDDLPGVLQRAVSEPGTWATARDRTGGVVDSFSFSAVRDHLTPHLERLAPQAPASRHGRPPRVVVAGHDLKFAGAIIDHLTRTGAEVRLDPWAGHAAHDEPTSRDAAAWADVVLCEWALGNAEWYSHRLQDSQRLLVRFHRQELETDYPQRFDTGAIERIVFVADRVRRGAIERFGWQDVPTEVVPNAVDVVALDRPKLPGADHELGMIGILPRLKGLARALDLLVELRRHDPRYRLSLAGGLPWDTTWVWNRASERQYFERQFDRIRRHRLLGDAVSFDGHVSTVPTWLQRVGVILSMSDLESFHLGLAEGMASRAVPIVRPWEGADELWDPTAIHATPLVAARQLLASVEDRRTAGERAREWVVDRYDQDTIHQRWTELVLG